MRTNTLTPDGLWQIVDREVALTPHPHPSKNGELVPTAGITKVWLQHTVTDNGTTGGECDECGKVFVTEDPSSPNAELAALMSVRGHISTHSGHGPLYPEETLRLLVRLVKTEEVTNGQRGKCMRVAEELNRRKIETLSGDPWIAVNVSSLYSEHKDRFPGMRIRNGNSRPKTPAPRVAPDTTAGTNNELIAAVRGMTQSFTALAYAMDELRRTMKDFKNSEIQAALDKATRLDPEIAEKARQFDALQAMFGGKKE